MKRGERSRRGLTRRSLLRRGGVGAAGAGVLGLAALPQAAAAQADEGRARNVVLVVLPLVRADHVKAFEGDSPADTPKLDDAGRGLAALRSRDAGVDAGAAQQACADHRHPRRIPSATGSARTGWRRCPASIRSGTTSRY